MAGRSGSPGDQYVRHYPVAGQVGGQPPAPPHGYGGHESPGPAGTLLGPQAWQQPGPPQQPARRSPSPRRRRLIDYPRADRTGVLRWIPSWKLSGTIVVGTSALMIVALLVAYAATPIPAIQADALAQTTTVYYSDGRTILTKFSVQNRTIVSSKNISERMKEAAVAAEDRSFWDNRGVSPVGILRAAWNNVQGGDTQGGSTITQQYVKNSRLGNARTVQRKVKEFFIALKLGSQASKEEILVSYLNTIYFGRRTYGIEAAARSYFNTSAAKLTVQQSAYLAGIIQGPELYDVADDDGGGEVVERARLRYVHVLEGLVEMGKLQRGDADRLGTPEQFTKDVVGPVQKVQASRTTSAKKTTSATEDQTIYLETMVRAELSRRGLDFEEVSRGGYKIYTTFDKKLMTEAGDAVRDKGIGMGPRAKWPKGTQVGLVSIEPGTGAVRAIYGGNGVQSFNAATDAKPQAGSIYKIFTLLAAVGGPSYNGSDGISLKSRFQASSPYRYDPSIVGKGSNQVSNYPGESASGKTDLVNATAHSVNTVFAGLNEKLYDLADRQGQPGDRTRDAALRAGLPKEAIGREISNTLGNGTPTVAQMASAYGTIAAGGTYRPYYVIEKIHYPNGQPRYTHRDESDRRFSKDVTADVTFAMQQVLRRGTGTDARRILKGRPAAGKTGTVGSLEGDGRDTMAAWFVGFTPQLSTSVVIYRETPTQARAPVKGWGPFAGQNMTGGMFPARIWATFMDQALKGKPFIDFPEPAFVGEPFDPASELPDEGELPSDTDGQNNGDGQGNGDGQNNGDGQGNGNGQNGNEQNNGQNGNGQGNGNGQNGDGNVQGQNNGQNGDGNVQGQNNGQNGDGNVQNGDGNGQNGNEQNGQGQSPGGATQ